MTVVARPVGAEVVYVAVRAPTVSDDFATIGARVGSRWVNQVTGEWWKCRRENASAAVWDRDSAGVGSILRSTDRATFVQPLATYAQTSFQVQGAVCFVAPSAVFEVWHRMKISGLWWENGAGSAGRTVRQFFPGPSSMISRISSRSGIRPMFAGVAGSLGARLATEGMFGLNSWPGINQQYTPRSIDLGVQFLRRTNSTTIWASKQTTSPTSIPVFVGTNAAGFSALVLGTVTTLWTLANFEIVQAELVGNVSDQYRLFWTSSLQTSLSGWTLTEAL